jgi:DGQHR domain-containing protein
MEYIVDIPFIEVNQPIGRFYVASMKCKDILEIARFDIRRIERDETNDIDNYFGIQRKPSPNRLKEISEYVKFVDATFPNNIVIAIKSLQSEVSDEKIRNIKVENGKLSIRRNEMIAQIIDGQHRLLGLQKAIDDNPLFSDNLKEDFELPVTIYVDMDIENQSMVFATINKAQTKVNKSLVYDLYDLANTRSPYRTAHNIVRVLNENNKSPLKNKIKMLGVADDNLNETIAQATIVECIVKYISKNGLKDRDDLKRKVRLEIGNDKKLFFRNWFIQEKDLLIARTLLNYFLSIQDKWETAWNSNSILVKSTGIIAFMNLLSDLIKDKQFTEEEFSKELFDKIFSNVQINDADFNNDNYPSGGIGQSKLRKELLEQIKTNNA